MRQDDLVVTRGGHEEFEELVGLDALAQTPDVQAQAAADTGGLIGEGREMAVQVDRTVHQVAAVQTALKFGSEAGLLDAGHQAAQGRRLDCEAQTNAGRVAAAHLQPVERVQDSVDAVQTPIGARRRQLGALPQGCDLVLVAEQVFAQAPGDVAQNHEVLADQLVLGAREARGILLEQLVLFAQKGAQVATQASETLAVLEIVNILGGDGLLEVEDFGQHGVQAVAAAQIVIEGQLAGQHTVEPAVLQAHEACGQIGRLGVSCGLDGHQTGQAAVQTVGLDRTDDQGRTPDLGRTAEAMQLQSPQAGKRSIHERNSSMK
ncbi:MAG: hypothetical protein BWY87_00696 [Deltaproteobacteria bacterium ADurb.Bin510]|nr:MAG: hypothetical protein BWY87_00696 [Deltaproteobacteria bacterium ADurb.Bin510]